MVDEGRIFELISYMVVSARNLLDETPLYGPFRLVDAASRLIALLEQAGEAPSELKTLQEKIESGKYSVMQGREEFQRYLDSLVEAIVDKMILHEKREVIDEGT